jgi:hypothetical protein
MLTPQEVLDQLRPLKERIPDFALLPSDELRRIRRAGYDVGHHLTRKAVDMAGDSEVVEQVLDRTADELAQLEDEAVLWREVEITLRILVRGVSTGNAIRRRRLARLVQRAVRVAATLAESPIHEMMATHVEIARKIRKSQRRKRRT